MPIELGYHFANDKLCSIGAEGIKHFIPEKREGNAMV